MAYSLVDGIKITVAGDSANGDITIRLFDVIAPLHVSRIIQLTRDGLYDGVAFHRVIDGFMAQTGDVQYGNINGDLNYAGAGGSDYSDLEAEFSNIAFNRSIVGMARSSDPDSANSQFFMMFAPTYSLNGQYTVIGQVIEGLEVLDSIKRGDPISGAIDGTPDYMAEVQLITASESTLLSIDSVSGDVEFDFVPNLSTIKHANLVAVEEQNGIQEFKTLSFNDGINISDAILVLKQIVGITQLTGNAAVAADANQDGEINISDAVTILKHIVGITPIETAAKVDANGEATAATLYQSLDGYTLVYHGDVDLSSGIELL